MPTLADIFSGIATAKRQAGNFIRQPVSTLQEMVALANDEARKINQQTALSAQGARQELRGQPMTSEQAAADQDLQQKLIDQMNIGGMTVYHGSPYKFTKFDPAKIGSGEGAQVYGHGLYVAENPNVAKQYQKNVKDMASIQELNAKLSRLNRIMEEDNAGGYRKFKSDKGRQAAQEYDHLMEIRNQKSTDPGNLYKIDLPDEHIERMLDWDAPFSEQHKDVKRSLLSLHPEVKNKILAKDSGGNDPTGGLIHNRLQEYFSQGKKNDVFSNAANYGAKDAADELRSINIHGIKYLDQDSRGIGQGSRNFVIFPGNEHLLTIQDINGNPVKQF